MKCQACDKILSDAEDAQKFVVSGARVGLCTKCVAWIPSTLAIVGSVSEKSLVDDEEYPDVADNSFVNITEVEGEEPLDDETA